MISLGNKMFCFEGNGGNKSLLAREGTVDEVSRGGDGDDHHQGRKVRWKTEQMLLLESNNQNQRVYWLHVCLLMKPLTSSELKWGLRSFWIFFSPLDLEKYTERNHRENTEHLVDALAQHLECKASFWVALQPKITGRKCTKNAPTKWISVVIPSIT